MSAKGLAFGALPGLVDLRTDTSRRVRRRNPSGTFPVVQSVRARAGSRVAGPATTRASPRIALPSGVKPRSGQLTTTTPSYSTEALSGSATSLRWPFRLLVTASPPVAISTRSIPFSVMRAGYRRVTVEILDPETMEPQSTETRRFYPVEQHG